MNNAVKLTEKHLEVLAALKWLHDRPEQNSRTVEIDGVKQRFATPLCFGGRDGSHHSSTATALAKKGLVDRYKGGRLNFFQSKYRGSCCYRITNAGLEALAEALATLREKP